MARLGDGTEGMATSIAMATLAPGGTVVVPAALVMDEVEHQRAGIGCMLESTGNGELHVSVVVPGGAAHASGLQKRALPRRKKLADSRRKSVRVKLPPPPHNKHLIKFARTWKTVAARRAVCVTS